MPEPMRFDFRFRSSCPEREPSRRDDAPMRILVMGDLSGRGPGTASEPHVVLDGRPIVPVDHETLDRAIARFAPGLRIAAAEGNGPQIPMSFKSLDDFHPDRVHERLGLFQALLETRQRLSDPRTFHSTAAELSRRPSALAPAGREGAPPAAAPALEDEAATLTRLLGSAPADLAGARTDALQADVRTGLTDFIRGIVAPHIVPAPDPRQEALVASVDRATGEQMRALLHRPEFQTLEALWRSVQRLVCEVETGEQLKIFLLDAAREELAADARAAGSDLEQCALHRLLVERGAGTQGGQPWSLIVGAYSFATTEEDTSLLAALGAIASRSGGPFLAAASPAVLGCRSLAETPDPREWTPLDAETDDRWSALRRSPWARWIGLALPRVLVRLPYGKRTDRTERFDFEEMPAAHDHEALLWGNPAFACATMLARSFAEGGRTTRPDGALDLANMPAHVLGAGDGTRLQPCAEVALTQRAADTILGRGVIPVMSFSDRNAVRVVRFQSLADPPAALAGAWN